MVMRGWLALLASAGIVVGTGSSPAAEVIRMGGEGGEAHAVAPNDDEATEFIAYRGGGGYRGGYGGYRGGYGGYGGRGFGVSIGYRGFYGGYGGYRGGYIGYRGGYYGGYGGYYGGGYCGYRPYAYASYYRPYYGVGYGGYCSPYYSSSYYYNGGGYCTPYYSSYYYPCATQCAPVIGVEGGSSAYPPPDAVTPDGFRYDGGPSVAPPMPEATPGPATSPKVLRFVSAPAGKIAYPAYGEPALTAPEREPVLVSTSPISVRFPAYGETK